MAKHFIEISKNSKVDKKLKRNEYERNERVTSCRLVLGDGVVLKVNEIVSEVNMEPKQNKCACFCDKSSSKTLNAINATKKRNQKTTGTITQSKGKEKDVRMEEIKNFMNDLRQLKIKLLAINKSCVNKFEKILKPPWFIPLTSNQVALLNYLPTAVEDDGIENVTSRTKDVFLKLGFNPMFPGCHISRAIKHCNNNVVLLLDDLLQNLKTDYLYGREDVPTLQYFPNEQLIMSAICWYELPLLLVLLLKIGPHRVIDNFEEPTSETHSESMPLPRKYFKNPYIQPIFTVKPFDWLKKKVSNSQKTPCCSKVKLPEAVHGNLRLLDYISFPPMQLDRSHSVLKKSSKQDVCFVTAAFHQSTDSTETPSNPPASRCEYKNDWNDDVSDILNDVLHQIQGIYKNMPNSVDDIINTLQISGMRCVNFSDIINHPTIIQLLKCLQNERITQSTQMEILKKVLSFKSCLRHLYTEENLEPKRLTSRTNWGHVDYFKKEAAATHRRFLQILRQRRLTNSINFYHTLSPEYFSKSFNDTFCAYMPAVRGSVNCWPNK